MTPPTTFTREVAPDGTTWLRSPRCSFAFVRPRPGVILVRIVGAVLDTGELGTAPMDELRDDVARLAPVEIFFDTTEAAGAVVAVQDAWGEWFARNRASLAAVNVLVRGSYMQFTIDVVKLFSRTGELIRIYLDPAVFSAALARSTAR